VGARSNRRGFAAVITVGGGLAGAALAKVLAERGVRVLVIEREIVFRDRVRGEQMHPWGVAEARRLGLYELLLETCGSEVRYWSHQFVGSTDVTRRDLFETSPHRAGSLNFYHPDMQSVVTATAEKAGATILRRARVAGLSAETPLGVRVRLDANGEHAYRARLVVGADGRSSMTRQWGGFRVEHDPTGMILAGLRIDGLAAPEDSMSSFVHLDSGMVSLTVPLGNGRFRVYVGRHKRDGMPPERPWSGKNGIADFISANIAAGAPATWYASDFRIAGPLASYNAADHWVDHPHRAGIVLIGDAAASNDPCFGCGLSLTLRDVRVLSDYLLTDGDWSAAADAYAKEHDRHYGSIHRMTSWLRYMWYDPKSDAIELRARAFPRLIADPARFPDFIGTGPDFPADENHRRRFFCED
jgi:2-polyprenyl-6-methoxyphenol hydroxylase-like FAD-dependent oxidoreductase